MLVQTGLNVGTDTVSQTPVCDSVEEVKEEPIDSTATSGAAKPRHEYTKV